MLLIQNKAVYYAFFISFAIEIYTKSSLWQSLSDHCFLEPQLSPLTCVLGVNPSNHNPISRSHQGPRSIYFLNPGERILGQESVQLRPCSPCVGGTSSPLLLICLPLPLHESDLQNTMPSASLGTSLGPCSSMKLIMEIS